MERVPDRYHRGKQGSEEEGTDQPPTDRQRPQELTCTGATDTEKEADSLEPRELEAEEPEARQHTAELEARKLGGEAKQSGPT